MVNDIYTDFHYRIVKSKEPGYVCVEVTFKYKGLDTKHLMFFDEKKGFDYLAEAKKQVEEDIKNERFHKVVHQHHINPVKVAVLCLLGVGVMAAIFAPLSAKLSKSVPTFSVKFDMNNEYYPDGGKMPATQPVFINRSAVEPKKYDEYTPRILAYTVDGVDVYHEFQFWSTTKTDIQNPYIIDTSLAYDFESKITADVTLYATWSWSLY